MILSIYLLVTAGLLSWMAIEFVKGVITDGIQYMDFGNGLLGSAVVAFALTGIYLFINQIGHFSMSISFTTH